MPEPHPPLTVQRHELTRLRHGNSVSMRKHNSFKRKGWGLMRVSIEYCGM